MADFCRAAWHVLEPTTELIWSWHLDAICEHLEAVSGGEIRNLVINIGPGHMKSLLVSVLWSAWEWGPRNLPHSRWLFSSYADVLSIRDNLKCRRLIRSPWYQDRWGDAFRLTEDQDAKKRYENDKTGYRIATSVGGAVTGERGNRIVVDDPHNVKDRESDARRESAIVWWDEAMSTRLNDPRKDAKVIIQQRVHEKDLTGHVLSQGGYEHLCLPTEFEPSRKCVTGIGWEDPRRTEGQLLFPQRFGPPENAEAKIRMGALAYAGQHGQSPSPAGGGRFKQAWFRYAKREGEFYKLFKRDGSFKTVKIADCDRFAMMDPAGTDKEQNEKACWTVIGAIDITPEHDMIVFDVYREQVETPDAADAGTTMCRKHDCPWLGVEKDGIGLGVIQQIKRKGTTVRAIKARGSKEARSETAELRMSAGMVYFLQGAPWGFELEKELLLFPNGEFKDHVDMLAHAAIWVQKSRGAPHTDEDADWQKHKDGADRQAELDANAPKPDPDRYAELEIETPAFVGWDDDE